MNPGEESHPPSHRHPLLLRLSRIQDKGRDGSSRRPIRIYRLPTPPHPSCKATGCGEGRAGTEGLRSNRNSARWIQLRSDRISYQVRGCEESGRGGSDSHRSWKLLRLSRFLCVSLCPAPTPGPSLFACSCLGLLACPALLSCHSTTGTCLSFSYYLCYWLQEV